MHTVAVIGLGNISKRHRKNLKTLYPQAKVLAMSASGRALTDIPQDADAVVDTLSDLINAQPQFVIVASPASMHQLHAQALLAAGIPCLIEKPLCANRAQTTALLDAVQGLATPAAVGYCLRHMPSAQQLQQLISSGKLGELYAIQIEVGQYLPNWRPNSDFRETVSAQKALGGGALLELSHEIDYANWLFGPLQPKYANIRSSKDLGLEVEDLVDVSLTTQDGAHVQLHLDFLQRQASRFCRVLCSEGKIHWDLLANSIEWTNKDGHTEVFSFPHWQPNDMYLTMLKDFENKIAGQPNQGVSLTQAADVMTLIDNIKKIKS
tara:strand:- start:1678 stop:2643 length:966 start_codon:yes stop_codon:yes gene_type:complete